MKAKIKNISIVMFFLLLSITLILTGYLFAQKNVYDFSIPPSLEGISLTSSVKDAINIFEKRGIYERYLKMDNHITILDPYLLYSQRYYTDYFNSFLVKRLVDGNDYLIKFDDILISKQPYKMLKDDDKFYVVYNNLFSIRLKDKETTIRLNPELNQNDGYVIQVYDNAIYKIDANYILNLDKLSNLISEYNDKYGKYKSTNNMEIEVMQWDAKENIVKITISEKTRKMLEFIDYYRGEKDFKNNAVKIEIFNSYLYSLITKYKSDIYMDIIRRLSYEFKNKVDAMNEVLSKD
jgi:hypothetical protein